MNIDMAYLWRLVLLTLRDPEAAARALMDLRLTRAVIGLAFAAVVGLSVLGFFAAELVAPSMEVPGLSPMALTLMMTGNLLVLIFATYWTGRAMEGTARLQDVALMLSWLQFMMLAAQVPQTILALIAPGLGALFVMGVVGYALFLCVKFLKVANQFDTTARAAATLGLAIAGITLGLLVLLMMIGATAIGGPA